MAQHRKTVFQTPWFSVSEIPFPNNEAETYYCVSRPDGVVCLVLTDAAELVMVSQLRPPLDRVTLEMPAGGINPGETPEQAARREILEETGYACDELKYVTPLRLMINRENVVEHFFVALGARPASGNPPVEDVDVIHIRRSDLRDQMIGGTFDQSVALSGVYIAEQMFGFRFFDDEAEHIIDCLRR